MTNDSVSTNAIVSKGDQTRTRILESAIQLFAERGYGGTGIRDIENAAGLNRGVVTYHFGNKDEVWKAMFDHAFGPFLAEMESKTKLLQSLDAKVRARVLLEDFIRTSAARPYMNQLMVQENFSESWRSEWIFEHYLKPSRKLMRSIGKNDPLMLLLESDPHIRYAILGACNMVFSHRCEVHAMFGKDVTDEKFIDRHVKVVLQMVDGLLERAESK